MDVIMTADVYDDDVRTYVRRPMRIQVGDNAALMRQ